MYFVNFGAFKCNQDHFFDNFMHKTFAQFILHTFWYILMHIDAFWALRKKWVIFNQKNGIFQIEILCTIHYDNSFCIHFWCILMHSDAYWSILLWLNERKTTSLKNLCRKHLHNSFYIHLMHSDALDAFWCTLMHFDACSHMHQNACRMNCAKFFSAKNHQISGFYFF